MLLEQLWRKDNLLSMVVQLVRPMMHQNCVGCFAAPELACMLLQVMFLACCLLLVLVAVTYVLTRKKPVYLVDYHCYKPPNR